MRMLVLIDEYTCECLAIRASRTFRSDQVLELLAELFVLRGVPEHIRSDNGPEFTAGVVREWLKDVGANALHPAGQSVGEPICRELKREVP